MRDPGLGFGDSTSRTPATWLGAVLALYFASTWLNGPLEAPQVADIAHFRVSGDVYLVRPTVLSGDSPHYLVIVNSLIEDADLDLRNNYDQARAGDWDAGLRFRWADLDRHVDLDRSGRELSFHSPFLPMLLSPLAVPFRGTQWVEPVCVWATLLAGFGAIGWFGVRSRLAPGWTMALAFAGPIWCYSRDLWTESWLALCWAGLLFSSSLPLLVLLGLAGTLFKYPFAVVPMGMGVAAWWSGRRREGFALLLSGLAGLAIAFGFAQYLFSDAGHFSLFHLAGHSQTATGPIAGTAGLFSRLPFEGMVGLLFSPSRGLLIFFPYLALGIWQLRKEGSWWVPALLFFLVHALYGGWRGGAGFSARYLVPTVPLLVLGAGSAGRAGCVFLLALLYSLIWGVLAGIYPALSYNRSPLEMLHHLWNHLSVLI